MVNAREAVGTRFQRVVRLEALVCQASASERVLGMSEGLRERIRPGTSVARGRQGSGSAPREHLAHGRDIAGDDGNPDAHSLQDRAPEALPARRKREHVGGGEKIRDVVPGSESPHAVFRQRQVPDAFGERGAGPAGTAGEDEHRRRKACPEACEGFKKDDLVLLRLLAGDVEDQGLILAHAKPSTHGCAPMSRPLAQLARVAPARHDGDALTGDTEVMHCGVGDCL